MNNLEWETICKDRFSVTERLKVKNGWLVRNEIVASHETSAVSMCFVPDTDHSWKLEQ